MAAKPPPSPPPQRLDLVFLVDGDLTQHEHQTLSDVSVSDVIKALATQVERPELDTLYLSDDEKPLKPKEQIGRAVGEEFVVLHLGAKGAVEVTVSFNGVPKATKLSPSTTISTVIAWAISKKGHSLEGDPADFQLKLGEDLQPADRHIGQIAADQKVELAIVFKVKPQGFSDVR